MIGYKVFNIHPIRGEPQFIFHGVNKSRIMPFNVWLTAEQKLVTDGSCSVRYWSGFHIFPDEKAIKKWAKTVKIIEPRIIVKVLAADTRKKTHSKHDVILASKMKLTRQMWKKRRPLQDYR